MIDVRIAAQLARNHLVITQGKRLFNVTVEEAELSNDEKYWHITLSYYEAPNLRLAKYKIFKIDANSSKVVSMKIRTF